MTQAELQDACAVQATNDSSIVSKSSAELRGYMPDGTIHQLLKHHMKVSRRAPLIHRGYYIRYQAVRKAIANFLDHETSAQIVAVGCGYDDLFYRCFQKEPSPRLFIDIDFPELIEKKRVMLENNALYKDVLLSGRYILLGCDLTDLNKLETLLTMLSQTSEFSWSSPTQAISECVLTYMPVRQSNDVLSFFASHFTRLQWVLYEQIYPDYDAFGRQMVRHFAQRKARIHAAFEYPTLHDQIERLKTCGVENVRVNDMNGFWSDLPMEERQRVHGLEMFDEWEEWYVKCSHYFVAVAQNYPFPDERHDFPMKPIKYQSIAVGNVQILDTGLEMKRWAHTTTALCDGQILVFGGSGYPNKQSPTCLPRLQEAVIIANPGDNLDYLPLSAETQPAARVHHTCVAHNIKPQAFLFGGRESPQRAFNDVWCFDGSRREWTKLSPTNSPPPPRFRHASLFIPANTFQFQNDGVLIHGGISGSSATDALGCFWFYDLTLNTWLFLGSSTPRHSHTVHLVHPNNNDGPKVLVLGGVSHMGDFMDPILVNLNPSIQSEPVNLTFNVFGTRSIHLTHRFDMLVGGVDKFIETKRVKLLDKESLTVIHLDLDLGKDWMGVMHGVVATMKNDDFGTNGQVDVLIVGGGAVCFSMGSHFDATLKSVTFRIVHEP